MTANGTNDYEKCETIFASDTAQGRQMLNSKATHPSASIQIPLINVLIVQLKGIEREIRVVIALLLNNISELGSNL